MLRIVTSSSAAARLNAARTFLAGRPAASELVIVGASRGAADDFARAIARRAGATFGLTRFSLTELAAKAAATRIEGARQARGTDAGAEAIAARAALLHLAADACRSGDVRWARLPILLLDVPLDSRAEQEFVAALVHQSSDALATVPDGDRFTLDALAALGGTVDTLADDAEAGSDLINLRRFVFKAERPAERERAGDVALFSAPGEGRESVEIVRRILDEAARGVPFDEMAVFLRTPKQYLGLLEHACARGDVPAYFDRGTRRPDPAGRAFIALLSCAVDGLSAKRFDEYLSLGQVPQVGEELARRDD